LGQVVIRETPEPPRPTSTPRSDGIGSSQHPLGSADLYNAFQRCSQLRQYGCRSVWDLRQVSHFNLNYNAVKDDLCVAWIEAGNHQGQQIDLRVSRNQEPEVGKIMTPIGGGVCRYVPVENVTAGKYVATFRYLGQYANAMDLELR
jgi:hypothetical protein